MRLWRVLVDAEAEGVVLAGLPVQVERVGLGEDGRVPVGDGERHDDALTGADGLAPDLDVLDRDAA
jgi:hypothetical protein